MLPSRSWWDRKRRRQRPRGCQYLASAVGAGRGSYAKLELQAVRSQVPANIVSLLQLAVGRIWCGKGTALPRLGAPVDSRDVMITLTLTSVRSPRGHRQAEKGREYTLNRLLGCL